MLALLLTILLTISCIALLAYLLSLGASDVRVSGDFARSTIHQFIDGNQLLRFYDTESSWLPRFGVTAVERVGVRDAFRNAIFVFSVSGLCMLMLPVFFIYGVGALVFGLFTARWSTFGEGALALFVLIPLTILLGVILFLVTWLALLFQPCTPGYAILWICLGLPALLAGIPAGASPYMIIIVIFKE